MGTHTTHNPPSQPNSQSLYIRLFPGIVSVMFRVYPARQAIESIADYALGWAGGDCPISCFFRKLSCVVLFALSVHPPDFTSRVSVCLSVGHRESSPEDTGPQYSYSSRVPYFLLHWVNRKRTKKQSYEYSYRNRSC